MMSDMVRTAGLLAQLAAQLSGGGHTVAAVAAVAATFKRWVGFGVQAIGSWPSSWRPLAEQDCHRGRMAHVGQGFTAEQINGGV